MSLLRELNTTLIALGLQVETGVYSGKAPDEYIVITPMGETFGVYADNQPHFETQEARLALFTKGNYQLLKRQIVKALLTAGLTVTDRRYIGYESDTGYHHYAIDVASEYGVMEE